MINFTYFQWGISVLCALMIGFTKAGIPGSGILVPLFAASIMPAKESTGFVLPMLVIADIFAIIYWRRHVAWSQLIRLLPWSLLGIFSGFMAMSYISNSSLRISIGLMVLVLMGVSWLRERIFPNDNIPGHWLFAAVLGVLAGSASMMANAAGPIMVIYLVAMRLPKERFIGTSAWFFFLINLSKLPFSNRLDLISLQSLQTNLVLLPFIIIGSLTGIFMVHRISQQIFGRTVQALAVFGALFLIFI